MPTSSYNKPLPSAFGYSDEYGFSGSPSPKPLVELEMTCLSAEIRRKPSWWTKFRNPEILAKWRTEALAQADQMKESHVDYVLWELDGYAKLRDEESGAEVSCYDKIWQSDKLIPASLKARLIASVSMLANVSEGEKDWHPRSNGQILDLVRPSLYPIVYGRTLSYPEDSEDRDPAKLKAHLKAPIEVLKWYGRPPENAHYVSRKFQWLPTDFSISEDGKSAKSDGYINNLHPVEHAELHKTLEDLIAAYIPLFERVLTDSIPENKVVPERTNNSWDYDDDGYPEEPDYEDFSDDEQYYIKHDEWEENRPIVFPDVRGNGYELGSLETRSIRYSLGGKTIQVIVKLANIHLTPEKPYYAGGSWHVDGMKNEAIAVSGIYYYDEENITESRLGFRTAVAGPENYEQKDDHGCVLTWGIDYDDACVNDLGSVIISQDRCIAFPNSYQHRVSPFRLADKSKPGHRKIVALFLVNPAIHRPSTKIVPPQQKEWRTAGIWSNTVLAAKFAPEIIDLVGSISEDVMTRDEAERYRLELMDERAAAEPGDDKEWFSAPFSLHDD